MKTNIHKFNDQLAFEYWITMDQPRRQGRQGTTATLSTPTFCATNSLHA